MSLINYREKYNSEKPALQEALDIKNVWALPAITKASVNVGLGQHRTNKDMVKYIADTLQLITGQQPAETRARKAIAGFKIRQGDLVGLRVTLRGKRMNDFINRLINITLPRIREFKGITSHKFDRQGNLTIGLKDQIPFAEIGHDAIDKQFGLTITLSIANSTPAKSYQLLKIVGFPMTEGEDLGFKQKIN
jgi:large subunit ribosomal protein L5